MSLTNGPPPAPPTAVYPPPRTLTSDGPPTLVSVAAIVLAAALTVLYLMVKLLASVFNNQQIANPDSYTVELDRAANVLGVLGIVAIVPVLATIILGHLALRGGATTRPRRVLAAALGIGYLHLLMWGNRVVIAAIVSAPSGDYSPFVPNVFWWA